MAKVHSDRLTPQTGSNTEGRVTVRTGTPEENYGRGDFFRDLKKVARKLPPDHPSRRDAGKR